MATIGSTSSEHHAKAIADAGSTSPPKISIIIPAHNEESVVGRCLDRLLQGTTASDLEIVVICNGCSDRTSEAARSRGVQVLELPEPGKPAALNAGDGQATVFPRFYVDADVEVTGAVLLEAAALLDLPGVLACAPAMQVDLTRASWAVRAYYRAWTRLPYTTHHHIGSGVVGLGQEGRSRFSEFPDVIADDKFLQDLFEPSERMSTSLPAAFTVHSATNLQALLRRLARVRAGNRQLDAWKQRTPPAGPRGNGNEATAGSPLVDLWRARVRLVDAIAYLCITVSAEYMARRMFSSGTISWNTDHTSRQLARISDK
jgi:hypothetical protein